MTLLLTSVLAEKTWILSEPVRHFKPLTTCLHIIQKILLSIAVLVDPHKPHIASSRVVLRLTNALVPPARWSETYQGRQIIEPIPHLVASFGLSHHCWQHWSLPHFLRMFVMRQKGSWPSAQADPQPLVLLSFLRFTRLLWLRWWMEAFVALKQVNLNCRGGGRGEGGGGPPLPVTSSKVASCTCFYRPSIHIIFLLSKRYITNYTLSHTAALKRNNSL